MHGSRGPSRHHHSHRDHSTREEYEARQGSHRSLEGRRYGGEEGYGTPRGSYPGCNGYRKSRRVSIENAIGGLSQTLTEALDFYVNFKRDFDGETRGIQAYAGSDLLDQLWARKAKSIEGRGGGHQKSSSHGDETYDHDGHSPETNFSAVYRQLSESFGMAEMATPNSKSRASIPRRGSSIDQAGLDRLKKKLHDAYRDVKGLSAYASVRSGDTQALITEMELVLAYLDKCRDLWDPRGGKGSMNGHEFQDHDEQGQDEGDPDEYPEGEPGRRNQNDV
ncbi:hypothetical protein LPUS_02792 [Lasallia pustulata]|uniref:Uncharacterized protein n=1 Tax=Lasallia pustulata TaxID=136370 RepID=A0A1W5CTK5_9LECA|nr:hypothetical protein LPUS_02792 [Lasallia pustulata]